ncbi:28S ribosomal protein S24, mitochondrial [Holothuria leucospilota]|uniref:28S ribosomal protein S24, mitochondrial n=1 Tax=Holothuria leucospilota TaxID=206669 RepID=A0A9Q0YJ19_HOLLE|nr:28S ribosomal protein S24, mitochondrial [Holothuria leucospilota]
MRKPVVSSRVFQSLPCLHSFHTSSNLEKVVAGRVKVSKGEKPVTYEKANFPFQIGVRKSWNSHHTGNLEDEDGAAERTLEDFFIRKFIDGTLHQCLATDLIIKRRANRIFLVAIMLRRLPPQKFYFLIGYTEELLSHWFKCPVKMEVQIVDEKPIYKWL